MARKNKINTRLEILQLGLQLFLEKGYSNTGIKEIAKKLKLSPGNITYYFPSKENILSELVSCLCDYHMLVLDKEVKEGKNSLTAYLLEFTSMMAICETSEVAKDLYTASYTHPLSLSIIRKNDKLKAKSIFSKFCPDWTDNDFAVAETIVSGIEYASLIRETVEDITLSSRISSSLDAVMKVYNVPKEVRKEKIAEVLATDYLRIGSVFIKSFAEHVNKRNEKALSIAKEIKKSKEK